MFINVYYKQMSFIHDENYSFYKEHQSFRNKLNYLTIVEYRYIYVYLCWFALVYGRKKLNVTVLMVNVYTHVLYNSYIIEWEITINMYVTLFTGHLVIDYFSERNRKGAKEIKENRTGTI